MNLGTSRELWQFISDKSSKTSAVLDRINEIDSRAREALRSRLIALGVFLAFAGAIARVGFDKDKQILSIMQSLPGPQLVIGLCIVGLILLFVFVASSWQLLLSLKYVKLSPYYFSASGNPVLKTDEDWAEEFRPALEKAEKWFGAGADGNGAIVGFFAWSILLIIVLVILIPVIGSFV